MPDGRPTGAYASELAECWKELRDSGYEIAVASVRGGRIPVEARRVGDPLQDEFFDGLSGVLLAHAATVAEAGRDFDVVCVVGGHGAVLDLPHDADLQRLVETVRAQGGVVAAVCHGVAGLLGAEAGGRPMLQGHRVAAFTDEEERAVGMEGRVPFLLSAALRQLGAIHDVAPPFLPHVVVHDRIVTGQNPASAAEVARTAGRLAALPQQR
ncbi:type 1 glutamine amidotransferase domain-containing protein [Microlunatus lacustris]